MTTAAVTELRQTTPSEAELPTQRESIEPRLENPPTAFEAFAPSSLTLSVEPSSEESVRLRHTGEVAAAVADEQLQVWNFGGTQDPSHVSNRPQYHPGTRVVVDIPSRPTRAVKHQSRQALAMKSLLAGLRNRGYWPLRLCFENATRDTPAPGGKTDLRVSVGANGKIMAARLIKSTIREPNVGRCIASELRKIHLDRPLGRRLNADIVVSVWPGDLPLLALPREGSKGLAKDTDALDKWLTAHLNDFRDCFAEARKRDGLLWGRLALSFRFDDFGKPQDIREAGSHFNAESSINCVATRLKGLALPDADKTHRFSIAFRLERPEPMSAVPSGSDTSVLPHGKESVGRPSVDDPPPPTTLPAPIEQR